MYSLLMSESLTSYSTFTVEKRLKRDILKLQTFAEANSKFFHGSLWFFVGSAPVFWNLLAGIRGDLTDGFLRGSAVIQQRCVCQRKRPARNRAHDQTSDLYRAVETLKTTEAQVHSSVFFFGVLYFRSFDWLHWQEGRCYMMLIRISN